MDAATPAEPQRCTACHHTLPAWDLPRVACTACQQHTAARLASLPALYAQLPAALAPGSATARYGTRHGTGGGEPIRLDIVDLTGPRGAVLPVLTGWIRVWHEDSGAALPDWPTGEQQQIETGCRWLRWHLDWACRRHEAVAEAIHEIAAAWRAVHAAATGDPGERRIPVRCPCGHVLRVTASTPGTTCGRCGTRYGRTQVLSLPLAARSLTR